MLLNGLPFRRDSLVELCWPIHRLSLRTAKAIAGFLVQPSSLRKLTLEVNHLATNDGTKVQGNKDHEVLLPKICSVLAEALQVNQSLLSFSVLDSWTVRRSIPYNLLEQCQAIFAKMLQNQFFLENLNFMGSWHAGEALAEVQLYLKLNRHGRRHLLRENTMRPRISEP